jgi:hypothetical protein
LSLDQAACVDDRRRAIDVGMTIALAVDVCGRSSVTNPLHPEDQPPLTKVELAGDAKPVPASVPVAA